MEKEGERINVDKAISGMRLEDSLQDTPHSLHFPKGDDITEGINHFAAEHNIGLVAMVPHEHGVLDRIMNRSNTRKMVFHTQLPLLVLPS
jgi:hypothetical protein